MAGSRKARPARRSSAQFGRLGKLVVTANYVSPMLVDGIRIASRAGAKLVGKIRS